MAIDGPGGGDAPVSGMINVWLAVTFAPVGGLPVAVPVLVIEAVVTSLAVVV